MITTDYVSTFSGNRFYPLRPHIDKVAIEDIAHGLAYQCRFNGQTQVFYSIAQHSRIVASLVPPPCAWRPCCTTRPKPTWATW
jgi:hypothetical protein